MRSVVTHRLPVLPALVALSSLSAVHAAGNLIRNGGFEEGPGTFPGVGKYWEPNDAQPHPAINVLDTQIRRSGSFSQWLKASSQWDLGAVRQVTPYNSVVAGKTYRIQAWIKTANVGNPAGWYVFGVWWFQDDAQIGESKMPRQETNNYDWRLITWTAVAPPGADRVAALLTRHTDGDAWYDDIYIAEEMPGAPLIALSPNAFDRRVRKADPLPDDVLNVYNAGGGMLDFVISSDVPWLTAHPGSGSSVGDVTACTLVYSPANLPAGVHSGTLTLVGPAAANSPQYVSVTLTVTLPGDFDGDGDVDQEDFGRFQACYTGSGIPQPDAACAEARLDGDDDVDLDDFLIWAAWHEPNPAKAGNDHPSGSGTPRT